MYAFRYNYAHVDDGADGDRYSCKAHYVGIHTEHPHSDESQKDREGKGRSHSQRGFQVEQECQDHQCRNDHLPGNGSGEGPHGFFNQLPSVVVGSDLHPIGKTRGQPFQPLLNRLYNLHRVSAVSHNDDAPDQFAAAVCQRTPSEPRAQANFRQISNCDRSTLKCGYECAFDVFQGFDTADSPYCELHTGPLDGAGTCIHIGRRKGMMYALQNNAVMPKELRVSLHEVLPLESSDTGYLRDPRNALQCRLYGVILNCPELPQVHRPLHCIPVDLPQGSSIGTHCRHCPLGKHGHLLGKPFGDPFPCPVDRGSFLKDHVYPGEAEGRDGSDLLHSRQPLKGGGQGICYLILHIIRAYTRPVNGNDDLIFGNIRESVHVERFECPEADA